MLKKSLLAFTLLFLLVFSFSIAFAFQRGGAIDIVRNRCREQLLSDTVYASEQSYNMTEDIKYSTDGPGYFHSLNTNGSWPDIDYQSPMRSSWKPSWHLYRTMLIYRAYHKNHDYAYLDAVHRALRFWIDHDFQCSNWWQNQINVPFCYVSLMLMLDKEATTEELDFLEQKLTSRMVVYKATGQNLIWQCDNQARLALLHRDQEGFARLVQKMSDVILVSDREGIQPDYSFHQHGPMLQFGNYGLHFVNSLLFWLNVNRGTRFAFSQDKQDILFRYCKDGFKWTIFKGAMDITAVGRQLPKDYTLKRAQVLITDFNLIRQTTMSNNCDFRFADLSSDSCALNGNKSFWRSGYMVQMGGGKYMMSVKTHGGGVSKVESINGENLKGAFLNDGVTLIQHSGQEYRNIEPFWNWNMLPGTTSDTSRVVTDPRVFNSSNNGADFVGQVSDGKVGISAMRYNRLGLGATKAYFLLDGKLVALGAGITAPDLKNIVTTLDQHFEHTNDSLAAGRGPAGNQWLWQGHTAYYSLDNDQTLKAKTESRTGNWIDIDLASPNKVISDTVSVIYMSHTEVDRYAYLIMPALNIGEARTVAEHLPVSVSANTADLQAVQSGKYCMAAFYKAGTLNINGSNLSVDKPCLLLAKWEGRQLNLWVSDPTRRETKVRVSFGRQQIDINLPQKVESGSPGLAQISN